MVARRRPKSTDFPFKTNTTTPTLGTGASTRPASFSTPQITGLKWPTLLLSPFTCFLKIIRSSKLVGGWSIEDNWEKDRAEPADRVLQDGNWNLFDVVKDLWLPRPWKMEAIWFVSPSFPVIERLEVFKWTTRKRASLLQSIIFLFSRKTCYTMFKTLNRKNCATKVRPLAFKNHTVTCKTDGYKVAFTKTVLNPGLVQ